ncbi:hypothetical protein [Pantoea vagans]|uniref:hypothetical protein n=1 Tax=Pantoea vagans TaxID=470934 RepID=UPI000F4E64F4|nr:hypothetical protein [Pantoea vagans]
MQAQQIINQQKEKINLLYSAYCQHLDSYFVTLDMTDADRSGRELFNYVELCCAEANSNEDIKNSSWNQWLAETCHEVLELLVSHYQIYRVHTGNSSAAPSKMAYAGMQRMVKSYYSRKDARLLRKFLNDNGISTYGFDNKAKIDPMKIILSILIMVAAFIIFISALYFSDKVPVPLVIGLCLSVIVFITCLFIKNPSGLQYLVIRTFLSASIPGLLASYPGLIELSFKQFGLEVSAFGLFAIFFIIYKINPAKLSELKK